jgi:hypothetical protein
MSTSYKDMIKENGLAIKQIPQSLLTKELCILAIHSNSKAIKYVPKSFIDKEMCLFALADNDKNIKYISDYRIRMTAIRNNPNIIKFIKPITKKMCENYNGDLRYIPEKYITEEMCIRSVKNYPRYFDGVPAKFMTQKVYKSLLLYCDCCYNWDLPTEFFTKQFSEFLLDNITDNVCSKKMFKQIPKKFIRKEMYSKLYKRKIIGYDDVPVDCRDNKFYIIAIRTNLYSIYDIPKEIITYDFIALLMDTDIKVYWTETLENIISCAFECVSDTNAVVSLVFHKCGIAFLPSKYHTIAMYNDAIAMDKANFKYCRVVPGVIDYDLFISQVCIPLLKQDGMCLEHIPSDVITSDLCDIAVKQNGNAIEYTPERLLTKSIEHHAVRQNGLVIYRFNTWIPNYGLLCLDAVRQNGLALESIPQKYQTDEMCRIALREKSMNQYSLYHYKLPIIYHVWYNEEQSYFKKNMSNVIKCKYFSDIHIEN